MGTKDEIHSILSSSPLHGALSSGEGDVLRDDLLDVGTYLGKLVDELHVLHECIMKLAHRVDELEAIERMAA